MAHPQSGLVFRPLLRLKPARDVKPRVGLSPGKSGGLESVSWPRTPSPSAPRNRTSDVFRRARYRVAARVQVDRHRRVLRHDRLDRPRRPVRAVVLRGDAAPRGAAAKAEGQAQGRKAKPKVETAAPAVVE